jgi:phage repressor protein C with HTH and peptisase S24 domain
MASAQRKNPVAPIPESSRKLRTDPDRLKAFAHRFNMMLAELGLPERGRARLIKERVGVSGTTAANWLRGESYPSFEELGRIGRFLGVDASRLLPGAAESAFSSGAVAMTGGAVSEPLSRLIQAEQVMVLTQFKTDNGMWDHTALPNSIWEQLLGRSLEGFVLLRMRGDSMGERIKDGTPLLVDTTETQIREDNAVYALLINDAVIVRRVRHALQGGYVIASDNPAIPTETIANLSSHRDGATASNEILVLGRVTLAIQKL